MGVSQKKHPFMHFWYNLVCGLIKKKKIGVNFLKLLKTKKKGTHEFGCARFAKSRKMLPLELNFLKIFYKFTKNISTKYKLKKIIRQGLLTHSSHLIFSKKFLSTQLKFKQLQNLSIAFLPFLALMVVLKKLKSGFKPYFKKIGQLFLKKKKLLQKSRFGFEKKKLKNNWN